MNQTQTEAKAFGRYIRMSPNKVRRVLNQIRGKSYKDALMLLEFMPYRACGPVWQVIYSAAANAQNNLNIDKENLYISEAFADQGPVLRRFRPRARGMYNRVNKHTSHIFVTLTEKESEA